MIVKVSINFILDTEIKQFREHEKRGYIVISYNVHMYICTCIYIYEKNMCMHSLHAYMHDFNKRKIHPLYMIKNSHHLSFRNSQNGFSNWVSLMIYLFCKQYHTSVIIFKMLFHKLSFIVKIVFVTLCSVRKMDVSLLCFKTFFGALYTSHYMCLRCPPA